MSPSSPTSVPLPRVLVALSGGVDSSVAAHLLAESGHAVVGVFMRNGVAHGDGSHRSCCSASDARDAAAVADRLDIPFYVIDYAEEFAGLIAHFAAEYRRGRTPNPCVLCNQHLKFGRLFAFAEAVGASAVATGHYARAAGAALYRARDAAKDQTYYLFGVARGVLDRIRFPLGGMTKDEVRAQARQAGLCTAEKAESMEICFVPDDRYRDVVRMHGGAGRSGVFVDESGRTLGHHDGIDGFTVGQRRGLPALGAPRYVKEIRPASGEVVLAAKNGIFSAAANVRGVNWLIDPPATPFSAEVQVRARSVATAARITPGADGVRVDFTEPVAAVTPGQAAVFYAGDRVLGGGWIEAATVAQPG